MSNEEKILDVGAAVEGRRRRFTPEQKRTLLAAAALPGGSIGETARRYGVAPSLLFRWKVAMDDASHKSLKKNERVVPESEVRATQKRIRELERLAAVQRHLRDPMLEWRQGARRFQSRLQRPRDDRMEGTEGAFQRNRHRRLNGHEHRGALRRHSNTASGRVAFR